jgi:hypothetical protein
MKFTTAELSYPSLNCTALARAQGRGIEFAGELEFSGGLRDAGLMLPK